MYQLILSILYRLWVVTSFTSLIIVLIFWFFGGLLGLTAVLVGAAGILYKAQDLLLYFPYQPLESREFVPQPSSFNLPYESYKIEGVDGVRVHMFLIKQSADSENKPTMIFFHGNAGNMGQRLNNVSEFYHKLDINILMVEYRGFGLSEGSPSEQGLYTDAQTAFDFIMQRSDVDRTKLFLFGRSLGGAIAIDLASRSKYRNRIWAVVLENTFTSIPDMATIVLKQKWLKWVPMICHKNKYMSIKKISLVTSPTLVICGSEDSLVPPEMSRQLYLKCPAGYKRHVVLGGGEHESTWTCVNYYPSIKYFLDNVPPLANPPPYKDEADRLSVVHIV